VLEKNFKPISIKEYRPMNNMDRDPMSIFRPYEPERNAVLLFRINSVERLTAMQQGLLYMNSLSYFAKVENEPSGSLRGDPLEPVLGQVHAWREERREIPPI
jgi:hypothetical protein